MTAPAAGPGAGVAQGGGGPATLDVAPRTVTPGRSITAVLQAPADTRSATVTLGQATVSATRSGARFVATLTVPPGTRGGFLPVEATYLGASGTHSVTTQVKVFTP